MPLLCAGLAVLRGRAFRLALILGALTMVGQLPNVVGDSNGYLYAKRIASWTIRRVALIGVWSSAVGQVRRAIG
jgi:hypothetical protein